MKFVLVEILHNWVESQPHRQFTSKLPDRTKVIMIGYQLSSPLQLTNGVIQARIHGTTLFLLYINNILRHVHHRQPFVYAAEIKITYNLPVRLTIIFRYTYNSNVLQCRIYSLWTPLPNSLLPVLLPPIDCILIRMRIFLLDLTGNSTLWNTINRLCLLGRSGTAPSCTWKLVS